MKNLRAVWTVGCTFFVLAMPVLAECPAGDITGDCRVNLADLAALAQDWLMEGTYLLTVKSMGALSVQIGSRTGHDGVTNYTLEVPVGTEVNLVAPSLAFDGSFEGWSGDVTASVRSVGFKMDADKTLTVTYSMGIDWVYVNDPGVSGHEGFTGYVNRYETTNAQYAQFLNEALASGDIVVNGTVVNGADGSNPGTDFAGSNYYNLAGASSNLYGATNGGGTKIRYNGGVFTVDSGFEHYPVSYVSWYGATAFCNYYGWRLPTEWEWQAIADYDSTYLYGCGTSINISIANYADSLHPAGATPVGAFGFYGYALADMAGNVWEWTSTYMGNGYYAERGGCWAADSTMCTVSYRTGNTPGGWGFAQGFRITKGL